MLQRVEGDKILPHVQSHRREVVVLSRDVGNEVSWSEAQRKLENR